MYLRLICSRIHEHLHRRLGVFQAAFELLKSDALIEGGDCAAIRSILDWFYDNLDEPQRLPRSHKASATLVAIAWSRERADERLRRMHDLCALLDRYGIATHLITCDRPGVVVYEDEHQIAAVPFRDTPT